MFAFAILVGLYSYIIFFLGILGLLTKGNIFISLLPIVFLLFSQLKKNTFTIPSFSTKLEIICILILFFQAVVNLVGVLGPEHGFDALWYHLTIPKLYLETGRIEFIHGGLLYYSAMPKLIEMLYTAALGVGSEISAKIIHYVFGILSLIALYKVSRNFLNRKLSLLCILFFYSNLVVGWESITAYVDLARTFFEVLALWSFLLWMQKNKTKWLFILGIMIGLAITTKLVSMQSFLIYTVLIFFLSKEKLKDMLIFTLTSLIVPFPWFIFSYFSTGNPIYPFFSNFYTTGFLKQDYFHKLSDLFLFPSDPISPIYLATIPLVFIVFNKFSKELRLIGYFGLLSVILWIIIPHTGGTRFFIPYLPMLSLLSVAAIEKIKVNKLIFKTSVFLIIFTSFTSILYRGVANARYIPVLIGSESKADFLTKHLNFSYGDFYDVDNFFKEHIKLTDRVLLYGFHNLYYVNFPFVHESWIKKRDWFTYIAVQGYGNLPKKFEKLPLIYRNEKTHVRVYGNGRVGYY